MTEKKRPSDQKSNSVFSLNDFNSRTQLTEKEQLDEYYNPFEHRSEEGAYSTSGALAHLLKSSLGSGILSMPMAFQNAGLLFGMLGTVIVGILCTHCVHILVKTSHEICRQTKIPCLGFAETCERVFEYGPKRIRPWSNFAKQFVDAALMATYYGASCVYIVFISTSVHDVVNYDLGINWDIRLYIAMTIIPVLVIGQIRDLKYLVPFSAMANVFILVVFAIVLYYMFSVELNYADKPLIADVTKIPIFFSTVIFAMEGIGVVMPVENSMRKPQHFLGCPGVLNTAMGVVVGSYAIIGFFGYVRYGNEVEASITLNLTKGEPLADVAKLLMAVAILFTYGLQFYVPNDILWRKIKHRVPENRHNASQIALRTGIILISAAVAALVPQLRPFIGLVGAIFFSVLGLLVPCVVETIFNWPHNLGTLKWKLWKNMVLGVMAIFALVAGSAVSIGEIIDMYNGKPISGGH